MNPEKPTSRERIDVHSHAIPPAYRKYLIRTGHEHVDGMPELPEWSPEQHIAMMDENNISIAILSISTPGTHLRPFDDSLTKEVTRVTNEELSAVCKKYPDRFRFFASLPLPNVAASIEEIDYALDTLGASGFCMLSNANGVYLGERALEPVFEKLNQREAVIFMHPSACKIISHRTPTSGIGESMEVLEVNPVSIPTGLLEYMFDETRAVANLLVSGTVSRFPELTFIMSHAGCLLPPVLERIAVALKNFFGGTMDSTQMKDLLRKRFYFDLAGLPWPDQIHGLLRVVSPKRIVYGSDYCWTPSALAKELANDIDMGAAQIWDSKTIDAVYAGNARALFNL